MTGLPSLIDPDGTRCYFLLWQGLQLAFALHSGAVFLIASSLVMEQAEEVASVVAVLFDDFINSVSANLWPLASEFGASSDHIWRVVLT